MLENKIVVTVISPEGVTHTYKNIKTAYYQNNGVLAIVFEDGTSIYYSATCKSSIFYYKI